MLGWIVAAALAAALVCAVALYERELRGMAHFLRREDRTANERATVSFSTPGISSVAAAANGEMDALRDERAALGARQEAFQRDLAALSHDIRTPLAGAQGYLQLHERSADPAERARCLREASSRLSAMRELTDRLFDYAKAADADSPLSCEPVEVLPALAEVLAGAYPQFAERGWEPVLDVPDEGAAVLADPEALSRIFSNLLANALRHGADAPRIAVGAAGAETSPQQAASSAGEASLPGFVAVSFANRVADPASLDADKLFERFYRADGARTGEGSGLGLAIVARLAERMGGRAAARLEGDVLAIEVRLPAA
ncbi:MAG TPA: HAMP domain-containing histidine kinase [Candidatus Aphodovivens avistercoris]|nr:HAMP domain-containing histidine kinase [Candidatus Aphodovivens avistercoris]